jgi:hypothetical protein
MQPYNSWNHLTSALPWTAVKASPHEQVKHQLDAPSYSRELVSIRG